MLDKAICCERWEGPRPEALLSALAVHVCDLPMGPKISCQSSWGAIRLGNEAPISPEATVAT